MNEFVSPEEIARTFTECGRPADLPVLFAGEEQWARLTSPDYPNYPHVHVHEWPTGQCSLIFTQAAIERR